MDKANDYLRREFEWFIANEIYTDCLVDDIRRYEMSYVMERYNKYKNDITNEYEEFRTKVEVLNEAGFLSDRDAKAWRVAVSCARREMINNMHDVLKEEEK